MKVPDYDSPSTKPYLIRALHEWCADNGFSPFLAVHVDASVQVPMEYVKNGEIVLNVSWDATNGLRLGNEFIEFKARFGGVSRDIVVPITHVLAIYARENGQGMAFAAPNLPLSALPVTEDMAQSDNGGETASKGHNLRSVQSDSSSPAPSEPEPPKSPGGSGKPKLTRVK